MTKFLIQGQKQLSGSVKILGSKNSVLPILSACLLTDEDCTLNNVPNISDVDAFCNILKALGAQIERENNTLKINTKNVQPSHIEHDLVSKMRASILLLGPLLSRFKEVNLSFPGGCVLGKTKRSIHAHIHALTSLGAEVIDSEQDIHLKTSGLKGAKIIMAEASVTATENAITAAVLADGYTEIRWAAMEPHIQDLCHFLVKMGAKIDGIGTPVLKIQGVDKLSGAEFSVCPDYLETGTLAIAGVLTNSEIEILDTNPEHLDSFWQKLDEIGAKFEIGDDFVKIKKHSGLQSIPKLQTSVYPGFPTDVQAPFGVLLTQCEGESRMFETLFDARLSYLYELEKMGADIEVINSHEAIIKGPTPLIGAEVKSCDIRAGAAVVLAALAAEGESIINDVVYIDRGYSQLDEKLNSLGAQIKRIN